MRFSKQDWLLQGLSILEELGPEEIKVDKLCKRLKVTKGSFYHHFGNREGFVTELLKYWREKNTDDIIRAADLETDPNKRNDVLNELAMSASIGQENAIRAWGVFDKNVAKEVHKVDQIRMDYLTELIRAMMPHLKAPDLVAKIAYAKFVGVQQLSGLIDDKTHLAMAETLKMLFAEKE